ncbi:protein-disulfide reductase DsbD family protein [Methylobacterium sp. NEAU 140]|uniref:protein-disulfide reductase DsbD family protein n=1 Tax=Methylobacterium sp. NEAU 140 TaxID=3064945 RepID=UPI002734CAFE|nr:protein-disulfide reductase DsbD domain-containing protein [Methylobacterium sp. NEAU 140]MDP4024248.1 protein-disulfide reductase DsbD family protein [Methylobacterium sp. NEAU 140]
MIARLALLVLACLAGPLAAGAQGLRTPPDLVRASLVAEPAAVAGAQPFTLAVHMRLKAGWHVYWRNPGDSGLPPEVTWTMPAGFSPGAIRWPAPERIPIATLMNYGYEDAVTLLVPVTPPPSLDPAEPVRIGAKLTYLVCETECVPGSADLSLTLPVGEPRPDPANAALFARARAALPVPPVWPMRLSSQGDRLRLDFAAPGLKPEAIKSAAFFPYSENAIDNAAEQVLSVDAEGLHLILARDTTSPAPGTLPGVLTVEEDLGGSVTRLAFAYGDEPAAPAPAVAPQPPAPVAAPAETPTLLVAAALAFLGGLILNLMPCVFPVLSIKVLGLVRHAGESPARLRGHGLAYTAGVLASFLGLAGLLIALKGGGAAVGWGFQLQSPIVVAGLAYLLFAMGLSLSGAVAFGGRLAGIGDGLARRSGYAGSFFTGVLATVVATPCTAPFMGTAVGFALTQSPGVALAVFASLGLGLALPFLILTLWPAALRALPRPGAWMETLKQVLAFPVYATVAWLVWVLAQQVDPRGLLIALFGLVGVGFAAWAWERGRAAGASGRVGQAAALAALLAVGVAASGLQTGRAAGPALAAADGIEPYTQARLDALVAEGRPVFVNLTAAWCITCAVNETTSLSTKAVRNAMRARGVTYLKGDWTNADPEITRLLERYGRSGVPLYLLYAGGGAPPQVLPQILTEGTVLAALDAVVPAPRSAALSR